jgi:hypothetical protein
LDSEGASKDRLYLYLSPLGQHPYVYSFSIMVAEGVSIFFGEDIG